MIHLRPLLLTIAISPALSAQDGEIPPPPKTTEAVPHVWVQRHEQLRERSKQGNVDLLFLGDTITHGWEREGSATWKEYYGDRRAANYGFDFDLTGNILWRLQNGEMDGLDPKVVVLQVGIYNLIARNTAEEVGAGVAAIHGVLRERMPRAKILLVGVFPAGARPNEYREKIARTNEFIAALADEHTSFLDIGEKFMEPDGIISQVVMYDYIAPAEDGYLIWAKAMEPTLAPLLGVEPKQPAVGIDAPGIDAADDPALQAIDRFIAAKGVDLKTMSKTQLPRPTLVRDWNLAMDYVWVIETNHGVIEVQLMPEVAPMHCTSTVYLSRIGFYDDLVFHRVIPGFMAQGGCPLGTGSGSPGYQYRGEYDRKVRHDKGGLLSMANAGPNTDGSQFFLTFQPTPWLDDKHTIFGQVVKGMDTLKELEKRGTRSGRTIEKLEMIETRIRVQPKEE